MRKCVMAVTATAGIYTIDIAGTFPAWTNRIGSDSNAPGASDLVVSAGRSSGQLTLATQ